MIRRLTCCLLTATLIALLAVPAAFAVTAGRPPQYDSSFMKVTQLGIFKGDERGLRPLYPITRAEFAAVVVRMLGLEGSALAVRGVPTPFADVPADAWAAGYINVAYSQGIVRGVTATTFEPARDITHAEAAAMILRALGKDHLVSVSAWPVNYLLVADDLGMFTDTDLAPDRPITRAEVSRYIDNSLTTPFDIKTPHGWATIAGKTILARLGFVQLSGRLTDADQAAGGITIDGSELELDAGAAVYGGSLSALMGHTVQVLENLTSKRVVYVGALDLGVR